LKPARHGHVTFRERDVAEITGALLFAQRFASEIFIKNLLLERLSLLGICRVMDVSLRWLLSFSAELYDSLPAELNVQLPVKLKRAVKLLRLRAEADEMWSFVREKTNKQWVWIAIDVETDPSLLCWCSQSKVSAQTVAANPGRVSPASQL
jgi:hypothetical protein